MERGIVAGVFVLIVVFTGVLVWLTPALTRRDLFFGVSVAPNARAAAPARRILRAYQFAVAALTLLESVVMGLLVAFGGVAWLQTGWPALVLLAAIVLLSIPYFFAHQAVRRLAGTDPTIGTVPGEAAEERAPAAALVPRRYGDYIPWLLEALPLLIIGGTALYLLATYPQVPARYATHFAFNGTPNGYATKSVGSYFALVWLQVGLEVLLTGLAILVARSRAQPDRADKRFRGRSLLFLYGTKVLVLAILGLGAVSIAQAALGNASVAVWSGGAGAVFAAVILVGALLLALTTGQGGSRLAGAAPVDRTDDRYWWMGIVYHNPDDPSILVERRFGVGWALNFGNHWAQLLGLLLLLVVVASLLLPGLLRK